MLHLYGFDVHIKCLIIFRNMIISKSKNIFIVDIANTLFMSILTFTKSKPEGTDLLVSAQKSDMNFISSLE